MRKRGRHLNRYRRWHSLFGESPPDTMFGYFVVKLNGSFFNVISSGPANAPENPYDWEHVSVSHPHRCANWDEMCEIKSMFFGDQETVVQFHPPKSKYVNQHPNCLHLWRNAVDEIPLPPLETV